MVPVFFCAPKPEKLLKPIWAGVMGSVCGLEMKNSYGQPDTGMSVFFNRGADALLAICYKIGDSDGCKNADDGDYHQNLDQGEAVFVNFIQIMASCYSVRNKASERNLRFSAIKVEMALEEMGTIDLLWESC